MRAVADEYGCSQPAVHNALKRAGWIRRCDGCGEPLDGHSKRRRHPECRCGTVAGSNSGCRCDLCKAAKARYQWERVHATEETWKMHLAADRAYRYSLTVEEYLAMMDRGCDNPHCGSTDKLAIDHNHACDHIDHRWVHCCRECVRGVLCHGCNTAEGLLKGDPNRADGLAIYMRKFPPSESN